MADLTTIVDDFNGTLDTNWSERSSLQTSIVTASGALKAQISNPDGAYYVLGSGSDTWAGGRIFAEVTPNPAPTAENFMSVLDYVAPNTNTIEWIIIGSLIYTRVRTNGVNNQNSRAYSATAHKFLSLRLSGGSAVFEASDNGVTWSLVDTIAVPWTVGAVTWVFTNGAAAGAMLVDKVNVTSAAPALPATSTVQDDFAGTLAKWPSRYGTTAVTTGRGELLTGGGTNPQYAGLKTDIDAAPLSLSFLEAQVYVQGVSNTQLFFGIQTAVDAVRIGFAWEGTGWFPVHQTTGYVSVDPVGTAVFAPAGTTIRLAIARGSSASRYVAGTYVAGAIYLFSAPADTTTWTLRYTIPAASVQPWVNSCRIAIEGNNDNVSSSTTTIDDVNLITAAPAASVPGVPTNVVATRSSDPSLVVLTWSAPTSGTAGLTGYVVTRDGVDSTGAGAFTSALQPVTPTQFTFQLLTNAAYTFTVRARNATGDSTAVSRTVAAYSTPTGPTTPTNPVGLPLIGSIRDDFNDATLDAGWVKTAGVVQANGKLVFPTPSSAPESIHYRGDMRGQRTFFSIVPVPGTDVTTEFFLRSSRDRTQKARIYVRGTLIYAALEAGAADANQSGRSYSSSTDVYLGMVHDTVTGTLRFEVSQNRESWTALRASVAAPAWLDDVEVGVQVFSGGAAPVIPTGSRPTVPTSVSRTPGATTATMTWSPPASDGGSPIQSYLVTRNGTSSTGFGFYEGTLPPGASSTVFNDLRPGDTYTLTVAAVNANGIGAVSTGTVLIPPGAAPAAPAAGATYIEDFTAFDMNTAWYRCYPYALGGAPDEGAGGGSYNAGTGLIGGVAHTPFSIANDASANGGTHLRITSKRTNTIGNGSGSGTNGAAWTGGIAITRPSFRYGYFEWRTRLTGAGKGMFPALWLFAAIQPSNGAQPAFPKMRAEIDMFEVFGAAQPWVCTLHMKDGNGVGPQPEKGRFFEDTVGWHTYGVDWQSTHIRFYRDNVLKAEATPAEVTFYNDIDMQIRLNYAMDAQWFSTAQRSDASTPPELHLDVDYVRRYLTKPA